MAREVLSIRGGNLVIHLKKMGGEGGGNERI